MSRTISALYDSRAEAEMARGRLVAELKTRSMRIIAKDTEAAVDGLPIDPKEAKTYREAIRGGSHLLVAEIETGQDPKRIIALLDQSLGHENNHPDVAAADEPETYGVTTDVEERPVQRTAPNRSAAPMLDEPVAAAVVEENKVEERSEMRPPATAQETRIPQVGEELRIDIPQIARGGARVHSVTVEDPADEQVALSEEYVEIENRPSERRMSLEDVEAGGLLRERIFEIREMREEPVVTKDAFVREEIIVRKTVQERTETVRDSVRRTEVEVEELPARESPRRGFFGGRPDRT